VLAAVTTAGPSHQRLSSARRANAVKAGVYSNLVDCATATEARSKLLRTVGMTGEIRIEARAPALRPVRITVKVALFLISKGQDSGDHDTGLAGLSL